MPSAPPTPFPLGAYLGNPDNSSAENQAAYDRAYNNFTALMGASPYYLTTFVDQRQAVSQWVGNSMWVADSAAQSANARSMTPVIALPLSSNAAGSGTPDQQFKAFASGQYDAVIKSIVQVWAQRGFSSLVFRPGWEMNLTGPTYAGDDKHSQADWVAAFQHVSTVLRQAAAASNVGLQVVWNPGVTNYSNAEATTNLYPGDAYVDVVGADVYADIHPYSDGGATPAYHNWNTGGTDTTVAQFIADPVNRTHYWSYPAATKWSNDGSDGHSQSLTSLIQFAQAHGKPFAVPETGAGNSNAGTDVNDNAAYPQWLSQQLLAAQASGLQVKFVNLWDSNGGGNYAFGAAADGKPLEAAAWAKYFGATPAANTAAAVTIGSGSHALALLVSEDAWNGHAQFTVSVDGVQVGGTQTATASHGAGQTQLLNVLGNFAAGSHAVSVNFLNDAYGGTAATDRNLYVNSATIDGTAVSGSALSLMGGGAQGFTFTQPTTTSVPTPTVSNVLDLHVSQDAWNGDAQFTIAIDGTTIGGVRTATASHAAGQTQDISLTGTWGAGPHTVGISFINDAYGGTRATDRNLYVNQVTYDGRIASGAPAALMSNGTSTFIAPGASVSTALTLHLAEDAWNGNAQYWIAVDGVVLVQNGTVTTLNTSGLSQTVTLQTILSSGTHDLAVTFLNDAYGGTAATDRNLYVKGMEVNGTSVSGAVAGLMSNGTSHFQFVVPTV